MQFIDLKAQYTALKKEIDQQIHGVLDHGQYIMGKEVFELESKIGEFLDIKHVISCANGTDALTMLYMAYNIGAGDAVFCPDITFFASVEPVMLLGATPVFCDIDAKTFNLSLESLEKQIHAVRREGKLNPRAVVAVDFLGNPMDYTALARLCEKYQLLLIEDAAQSFGGDFQGRKCGSFGDSAATSFFPAKPLGCYGDGGAIMTNDDEIAKICQSLRVHGKGKNKYENVRIGMNSRLDSLQAAILLPKLQALREYEFEARQIIARRYDEAFISHFQLPKLPELGRSAYAQYALLAETSTLRDSIIERLNEAGIPNMIYYPRAQHTLEAFVNLDSYSETFKNASDYCMRTFSIPMHPYLDQEKQAYIIKIIKEAIK